SLTAFDHAQDGKNVGLGWIDIAGYHQQAGDERRANSAYERAGERFAKTAELLLSQEKSAEANECIALAREAYEKARGDGERVASSSG
ncbi:hypothetical protein, partial [Pandoraea pneumonica]